MQKSEKVENGKFIREFKFGDSSFTTITQKEIHDEEFVINSTIASDEFNRRIELMKPIIRELANDMLAHVPCNVPVQIQNVAYAVMIIAIFGEDSVEVEI